MEDKTAQPEQMPENIGRYKVLEGIGFGAMGAVYKAFDPLIKRTLAIKTIRLDIPRQSPQYRSFIERFYHEARISGTLSHPNIVTLFDIGEESSIPYLAMEFVDGQTVAALIERGHRFVPEKVINLASQIAAAIDYAHGKGVIHRDIKPSNLILYEEDRVKVTDFGIAKLADSEMTQSGTLLGTPSYMSPEQAMGDKLDGRSDIFSLGVCCFEMLSGEQPFPGTNVTSILYKLVHVDPVEPANLEMHGLVPQKWHEVFGKVLAKKPDDRYQTATAFVQDLEFCLGSWFGALAADDSGTIAQTVVMHTPPPDDSATVVLSAPPAPVVAKEAEEVPATVVLEATVLAEDSSTIRMKAASAVEAPAATDVGHEPATVIVEAPPSPKPAAQAPQAPPPTRAIVPPLSPSVAERSSAPPAASSPRSSVAAPVQPAAAASAASRSDPGPIPSARGSSPPRLPTPPPPTAGEDATLRGEMTPTVKMRTPIDDETITVRAPAQAPPKTQPVAPLSTSPPPRPAEPAMPASEAERAVTTLPPTPVATARPRVGVPAGLVIGGGAAALLFGLTAAWLLLRTGAVPDPPPPSPTPPPVVESVPPTTTPPAPAVAEVNGVLRIQSSPPGGLVTVNGESRGAAPLEVASLAPGSYEVRVELRGYEAKAQTITITAEEPTADVKVNLVRTAPVTGTADILSTPFGAAIAVNGAPVGQTPLLQHRLRPGAYRIDVTKEGYEPFTTSLTVEAGKKARLDAELKAVVVATPTPVVAPDVVDTTQIYNNVASDVDVLARRASGSSPSYPSSARKLRSGESISVSVSFVVTEDGSVTEARVVESGGIKPLDEAVLRAIRGWKFSPASKRGVKVKVRVNQKQTFRAG
jgi:TonB family protein